MSPLSSRLRHMFLVRPHDVFQDWRLTLFLALCIGLGGTSFYVPMMKVPLYYISVLFMCHALALQNKPLKNLWCPPVILGGMLMGLYCLYLVPLPPSLWTGFAGRDLVVESFELTQNPLPWLPLSLAPRLTFESLFNFLPIIAIVFIMRLSANETELKIAERSIVVLAILSLIVGLAEVAAGAHLFSAYKNYTAGYPVGFFTNINHQASLSAVALPLAIFYALKSRRHGDKKGNTLFVFGVFAVILLILSLILTRSTSGYLFLVFNLSLALLIMKRASRLSILFIAPILALVLLLLVDFLFLEGHLQSILRKFTTQTGTSRRQIFATSMTAAQTFGIFGAGPGTFEAVYRIFENKDTLTRIYVNEAHNDYIQIWLELGMLGVLWAVAALLWFMLKVRSLASVKSSRRKQHLIYALCILTLVLHSMVDYPLRTMAMSAILTFLIMRLDSFRPKGVSL